MKCRFCSCSVENSNEKDGYQPNGCFYGDDYLDDYCYEDKDGDFCCDKTKEELELLVLLVKILKEISLE